MRLSIIFLLLFSTLPLTAQLNINNPFFLAGVLKPASGATTLYSESFEGTGYEVASTETGVGADEDDTTAATAGTQNLKVPAAGSYVYPTAGWTPASVITANFSFKVDTVGLLNQIIQIDASANGAARGYIYVNGSSKLEIVGNGAGSVSCSTADSVVAGTQYYCQSIWNKTAGTYQIEFNTVNSFTGSGSKFCSAGDGDTGVTIGGLRYDCSRAAYTAFFDQMIVTTP